MVAGAGAAHVGAEVPKPAPVGAEVLKPVPVGETLLKAVWVLEVPGLVRAGVEGPNREVEGSPAAPIPCPELLNICGFLSGTIPNKHFSTFQHTLSLLSLVGTGRLLYCTK